ncbi:MAG TPA: winged helix-turn-helix domain-containing protein [Dehalococcoidia bacterium]|jgi:predicted transcriptional regulator
MQRRRSNIEIIGDMLRIGANGGAGKTEIMYNANMSYSQLQKYLSLLINQGFIDRLQVGNPVITYRVTEKGSNLLQSIDTLLDVLEFKNDNF